MSSRILVYLLSSLLLSEASLGQETVFPHRMPDRKPDIELSSAMERMFQYPAPRVQENELFSQFKYSRLEGFDNHGGDGTISGPEVNVEASAGGILHRGESQVDVLALNLIEDRSDAPHRLIFDGGCAGDPAAP